MTPMTRDELLAELIRERFGAPPQPAPRSRHEGRTPGDPTNTKPRDEPTQHPGPR